MATPFFSARSPLAARVRVPSPATLVLLLVFGGSAVRLLGAASTGLGIDESYMVANARSFALGYVDHPPLHVWLAGAAARLAGSESALAVRLPFVALFAGSTALMYALAARLFGVRAGLWSALAFNVAPVFTLAHGSWVLPDGPLIFFALAAANLLVRIFFAPRPPGRPVLWWMAAGLCAGLACLSKLHGVFLFLGTFAFLLTVRSERRWIGTAGPWLGAAAALVVLAPAIVWNVRHDFATVLFQAGRLESAQGGGLAALADAVAGQALYLAPWLFVALAVCLGRALWLGRAAPQSWFLALLAAGPVLFFTAAALFAPGLPHWPMPGWLFAFPLLGDALAALTVRYPRPLRWAAIFAAAVALLLAVALVRQAATGAVSRAWPALFAKQDWTLELLDWTELASLLAERRLLDPQTPAVAAAFWTEAGKLDYALGGTIPVLCLCRKPQQFAFGPDPERFVGRDMILLGTAPVLAKHGSDVFRRFKRVELLAPAFLHRGGTPALEILLFRGVDFRG